MAGSDDKTLKEKAQDALKNNPTALGDPISMKAETSDTEPTENDRPTKQGRQTDNTSGKQDKPQEKKSSTQKTTLKEAAMQNPTLIGDPVSLKAEKSDSEPTENDRGAKGTGKKDSKL